MNIKKLKNIVIATSALACATCLTLAYRTARPVNAQADATSATAMTKTDGKFYMEGASIRYEKDSNGDGGIRFASLMQKSWLDGLQGSVATGMIVVPEYELDSVDYVGVMSAVTSGKAENVDTSNSYNSVTIGEEDYYQSLVSFYQIPKSEYNTTLVAISYVSLDGAVAYYTAEPLSRSVASVALGLIEEGETTDSQGNDRASELKGYLLKYSISFKNGDDFLAQSYVEYGEATPAYDGETPEKASDGTTHYLFKGWNDVAAKVTGSATYSAQFYSYEDCNGYYFQEGEKFALPDYKDAFTGETLSYSIGDETIDPSEVNLSAGTYTYKVTVGELGTIENQIEVLSKADYKTNYAKANSNQHLDRFAVNSNNTLSYDAKERNYTYKVTTNAQDASGLDLNTKYTKNLHGLNWSFNDYSALSVDFRIDSGDIPTALKSAFEYNAHGNSLLLTAMVLYSAKGTLVDTNALQKDVWYTAYVSFRDSFTELDVNTLHIYFYSAQESGTLSLKNVRFGDHDYGYFDRVYTTTSIGYTTETIGGRTGAIKVSYTNGVWNNRVQFSGYTYRRWNALCDSDKHAYFAMDIYSPEEKTLYTNNLSSPSGYFDADGNSIDKLQANAWTTVVWEITQKAKASGNATVSEKEDGSLSVSYSRTDKMVGDCGLEFGIDTTSITYYIDNRLLL